MAPLDMPLDTALPTRGSRPSSTHQWTGTGLALQETCTSLKTSLTHQEANTRCKKTTISQTLSSHSRPDPTLGPARPWSCPVAGQHKLRDSMDLTANCQELPCPTRDLTPALGSLGSTARLQDLALPDSSPELILEPGFTHQWGISTAPESSGP